MGEPLTFFDFEEMYAPNIELLEERNYLDGTAKRYSNGLEENSEHESVWFCSGCDEEILMFDGYDGHCDCNS